MEIRAANSSAAHIQWFDHLSVPGGDKIESSPRSMKTRETIGATTVLHAPNEHVPFVYGRKLNYFGMLMEALWILSRVEDIDTLTKWNSELVNFSDAMLQTDKSTKRMMYGAYGPRLFNSGTAESGMSQIEAVLESIYNDPDTRRGVATIYQPRDAGHPTRDLPCNTQVMFKLRDNSLHLSVINRSNDLHLGLFGVNAPQFYFLGNYVARQLRLLLGNSAYVEEQRHYSDSLHLYLDQSPQQEINERISIQKKRVSEGVSGQRFFDIYSFYKAPLCPAIIPDKENPTRSDYVGDMMKNIVNSHYCDSQTSSNYEACLWALLHFYVDFKSSKFNRDNGIKDLNSYLTEWLHDSSEEEGPALPFDWIAGAYYSLVAWGEQSKREKRADMAVKQYQLFLENYDRPDAAALKNDDFIDEFREFLVTG